MRTSISILLWSRILSQCFVSLGLSRSNPVKTLGALSAPPFRFCQVTSLPDATYFIVRLEHWLSSFAAKRLSELWNVHHHTVDAVFAGRVRIGDCTHPQVLRPLVFTSPLCEADEESLVRRQSVGIIECRTLCGLLPGDIGEDRSS